jgi:hypothetical protein
LLEQPADLDCYLDRRVVVTGKVTGLSTSGYYHKTFWDVAEGRGIASLGDDTVEDRPLTICVFRGGQPAWLKVGGACRIEGMFRGPISTARVPLLVDCVLVTEEP